MSDPLRVLIVEDAPEVGEFWGRTLREAGYDVDVALTMESALIQIRKIPPHDLIFLDLSLPDTSSKEETLKFIDIAKAANPHVKLIVATGYATPQIKQLALDMGASSVQDKIEMTSSMELYRIMKSQFDDCKDSREAVTRQIEVLEQLSKLIPVGAKTQRLQA